MEVDPVFSIANPFAFYYINQDFISDEKIFSGLERAILQTAKEKAEKPSSTGRYNKFRLYEKMLFESNLDELKGKYIIPMTAICIADPTTGQKEIICPFSNQNIVTNKMLELLERGIELDFLRQFVFWPLSPIDFMFCYGEKKEKAGIVHPLEKYVITIDENTSCIGFGSLFKNNYDAKQGNFNVYAGILEHKFAVNRFNRNPQSFDQTLIELGCKTHEDYIKHISAVSSFCRKILAQKYTILFDKLDLLKTNYALGVPELRYFGEKTSYGAKVLELVEKYSKGKFLFDFIGKSPLANIDDITTLGIAHPTAIHRLFGFITTLYEAKNKVKLKRPEKREVPAWEERGKGSGAIQYRSCPKYSFFLCELPECKSPCAKDIIETQITDRELKYIIQSTDYKRVGFSRIEPRLVQLANQDFRVYVGDRRRSKLNASWQNTELLEKDIEFLDLKKFTEEGGVGDLRGSEFTQECSIARLFPKISRATRKKIIAQELDLRPGLKADFFRTNDPETLEGIAAIKGIAIHKIISFPMESLAHYKTLEKGGFEAKPSDYYTELPFCCRHTVKKTGEEIRITFHPDCQLALSRGSSLDIVILDHKTNRKLPYPYVKYKSQGKVYAYCLKKITGIPFVNTYLIFNHMAFDNAFGMTFILPKGYPGSEELYRAQSFVPPTAYYPEHNIDAEIEAEIDKNYLFQKKVKQNPKAFLAAREKLCGKLGQCFADTRLTCGYFAAQASGGVSFLEAVERIK